MLDKERRTLRRPTQWGHIRLAAVDTQIDVWLLGAAVFWLLGSWFTWIAIGWCIFLTIRWLYLAVEMDVEGVR